MEAALLAELNAARRSRRAVAVATDLQSGTQRLLDETSIDLEPSAVAAAFHAGRSQLVGPSLFINVYRPPARLVIIGATHISQALAPMARIAGFAVEIVDPRTAFASPDRFPDVALHAEWPDLYLARSPLDAFTALACLTHDPKIDDAPLIAALDAGSFYVGALGSRKTHARRLERLAGASVPTDRLDRIDAPIGVAIGAATPAEIAVAVLAAVIAAFRAGKTGADRHAEEARL